MEDIWLIVDGGMAGEDVRRSILMGNRDARCVDVGGIEGLLSVSEVLQTGGFSVAIGSEIPACDLEGSIRCAAGLYSVRDVAVICSSPTSEQAARWFYAGATKVIAVDGAKGAPAAEEYARIEEEALNAHGEAAQGCDDASMGARSEGGVPGGPNDVETCSGTNELPETPPWEGGMVKSRGDSLPRAPLVAVVAGRGASGKTTVAGFLAACAARAGMRAAVIDGDLMLGNLPQLFGVDSPVGIEGLLDGASDDVLDERLIEETAMKIGPGLTLWGPCERPETVELISGPMERLIGTLRAVADVVIVDTPGMWGDATAMVIQECDRCLVVGSGGVGAIESARRVVELARMLGLPATKMTSVFNRFGARGCDEGDAIAFELACGLSSKVRLRDGGEEVASAMGFPAVDALVGGESGFASSMRRVAYRVLGELGCPVSVLARMVEGDRKEREKRRFRLPWGQEESEAA